MVLGCTLPACAAAAALQMLCLNALVLCCAVACLAVFAWQCAGKLKSEPLQRHINAYAAGKKCAAQVGVLSFLTGSVSLR